MEPLKMYSQRVVMMRSRSFRMVICNCPFTPTEADTWSAAFQAPKKYIANMLKTLATGRNDYSYIYIYNIYIYIYKFSHLASHSFGICCIWPLGKGVKRHEAKPSPDIALWHCREVRIVLASSAWDEVIFFSWNEQLDTSIWLGIIGVFTAGLIFTKRTRFFLLILCFNFSIGQPLMFERLVRDHRKKENRGLSSRWTAKRCFQRFALDAAI